MYRFVDRQVMELEPGGRFLLWAMRGWIHAMHGRTCPPGALAPAFARHRVLPALPHLHRLLVELNQSAIRHLAFAPLARGRIGDDEAVMLQTCRDAMTDPVKARATLALLIPDEAALSEAFAAILAMMGHLAEGGLDHIDMAGRAAFSNKL